VRNRTKSMAVMVALGVLAASSAQAENAKGEARLAKILEGRTVRAGVACIEVRKIVSSQIINGTAIVYRLRGSPTAVYVNRPMAGAEDLDSNNSFSIGQAVNLCEGNNLPTGDNGGRGAGPGSNGGVQLGEFVPYVKDEPKP
jgi:hypothetical protein